MRALKSEIGNRRSEIPTASVYLLRRVVDEVLDFCRRQAPREALGVLVSYRCQHEGRRYVRVVDWAMASTTLSSV